MRRWFVSFVVTIGAVLLVSCGTGLFSNAPANSSVDTSATPSSIDENTVKDIKKTPPSNPSNSDLKSPRLSGKATVELKLKKGGTVTIAIDGEHAPITAGNFIDLVNRGFYNNLTFHRVEKDPPFVVQGGDPEGNGTGGFIDPTTSQPRNIPLEILAEGEKTPTYGRVLATTSKPQLKHTKGAVAMARSNFPNSASSQFYITLTDTKFLDGSYAVFGYVTSGMDVVEQIQVGDRIASIAIVDGKDNLKQSPKPDR